jgi:hypothetical protein
VSISGQHALGGLSRAWLQAHGHAQIFGWLGTFIIGIGYYSLSKMGGLRPVAVSRGWTSWALWTGGVGIRWAANVSEFHWRLLLPLSAALQLDVYLARSIVKLSPGRVQASRWSLCRNTLARGNREPAADSELLRYSLAGLGLSPGALALARLSRQYSAQSATTVSAPANFGVDPIDESV